MTNEKPNYRLGRYVATSIEAEILASAGLRKKAETLQEKTFGCGCDKERSCSCNVECHCDAECNHCRCDDYGKCDTYCSCDEECSCEDKPKCDCQIDLFGWICNCESVCTDKCACHDDTSIS